MKRTERVAVYFTPEELARVTAVSGDVPVSRWIVGAALRESSASVTAGPGTSELIRAFATVLNTSEAEAVRKAINAYLKVHIAQ